MGARASVAKKKKGMPTRWPKEQAKVKEKGKVQAEEKAIAFGMRRNFAGRSVTARNAAGAGIAVSVTIERSSTPQETSRMRTPHRCLAR